MLIFVIFERAQWSCFTVSLDRGGKQYFVNPPKLQQQQQGRRKTSGHVFTSEIIMQFVTTCLLWLIGKIRILHPDNEMPKCLHWLLSATIVFLPNATGSGSVQGWFDLEPVCQSQQCGFLQSCFLSVCDPDVSLCIMLSFCETDALADRNSSNPLGRFILMEM